MFKEFEVLLAPRRVGKQQGYDNGNTKNYSARLFLPHEHQGRHNQLLINFLPIHFFHLFFFMLANSNESQTIRLSTRLEPSALPFTVSS